MSSFPDNSHIPISITGLTKKFKNTTAVSNLNLQIRTGESFALLGPDGSGKTTTMRLLCGSLEPTSGNVEIKGLNLAKQTDRAREYIGYMPQRFSLYENLSVMQNIVFFSDLYGIDKSIREDRIGELLDFSRLTPFVDRLAGNLSGGMKQKLALICTVIHRPPILLLDEPTTGVDPVSRRDFWKILHRLLTQGTTLFISTPYMDEAERCNRIGMIYDGKLMMVNTPDELKKQMKGDVIEVNCTNTHIATKLLKNRDDIKSIKVFSDRLRILMKESGDIKEIGDFLNSQNINISNIQRVRPSMEDIFVSIINR